MRALRVNGRRAWRLVKTGLTAHLNSTFGCTDKGPSGPPTLLRAVNLGVRRWDI
jgi:hypothetical protein